MNDPGFPGQHTTTTSVTQTTVSPEIRYDKSYFKTIPGILKIACIVLDFVGFLCIVVSPDPSHSRGSYFNVVAMFGFWFTGIMLAFYVMHVCEKYFKVPWLKIEMYFNLILGFLYLFAASFAIAKGSEAYTAAGFFGFCAMLLYIFDAYLKFTAIRGGEIAQGARTVSQHTQQTA